MRPGTQPRATCTAPYLRHQRVVERVAEQQLHRDRVADEHELVQQLVTACARENLCVAAASNDKAGRIELAPHDGQVQLRVTADLEQLVESHTGAPRVRTVGPFAQQHCDGGCLAVPHCDVQHGQTIRPVEQGSI